MLISKVLKRQWHFKTHFLNFILFIIPPKILLLAGYAVPLLYHLQYWLRQKPRKLLWKRAFAHGIFAGVIDAIFAAQNHAGYKPRHFFGFNIRRSFGIGHCYPGSKGFLKLNCLLTKYAIHLAAVIIKILYSNTYRIKLRVEKI